MKKLVWFILAVFTLLIIIKDGEALAVENNNNNDKQALSFHKDLELVDDHISYIPIWSFVDAIDAELVISQKTKSVKLQIDSNWLLFSTEEERVETSDGRTLSNKLLYKDENIYLPLQFVSDYFGYKATFMTQEKNNNDKKVIEERDYIQIEKEVSKPERKEKVKVEEQKPVVYLTFDDGPNEHIVPILDTLKEKQAKGTFFMLEPLMKKYSNEVIRLVNEGHYPALHSVTHDKDKLYLGDPLNVAKEMEKTRKTLLEITGVDSTLTRVPYGSKPFMKDSLRDGLVTKGFQMWDWNLDTFDWKYQSSNPQMIFQNVKNGVKALKGSKEPLVILMHVNKGTAAVLPDIIDYLHGQGYECAPYNPNSHFMMNFWNDERL
ncbi:polysaccharide deacetylase family protein [Bacillus sp. 31A1R]|uniref:Polysaccharide deacetylase family protein n=1 Tax=Robertmurraya mangrovi TaxID=3098077 RepID=A0ABU5J4W1_9BACI|nr:polysaccharide deacetylase family protein [Bacillus sp. 31A1R]MDZ5474455.1 polysaccharide deacetylase family protein [Bacillus sp. 31A1R]